MKYVRTARGYESLVVSHDGKQHTVTAAPLEVSNEVADVIVKAGEDNGVEVLVLEDVEDGATPTAQPQPDLSAGTSAISGTGDPVTTPDAGTTKKKAGN